MDCFVSVKQFLDFEFLLQDALYSGSLSVKEHMRWSLF